MVRNLGNVCSDKKVCIVCHGLGSGGIESFVVNLAKGLQEQSYGVKIVMAVDENGTLQFREQEVLDANIEVFRTCDLGTLKRMYSHCLRLYHYLKENKFDVVHSNMSLLNGLNLAIAWFAGVKIRVAHAHAIGSERSARGKNSVFDRIYQAVMQKLILTFANRKCGCSEAVVENAYGPRSDARSDVHVVYNGIDLDSFHARKKLTAIRKP